MNHLGTIPLETDQLVLRKFVLNDSPVVFENWANDEEVTRFLSWEPHQSLSVTEEVVFDWLKEYGDMSRYNWAICLKESPNQPIGSISVVKLDEDTQAVEIGYCLGKNWWHQEIMPEAFKAVIEFLFNQVRVNRITAKHSSDNPNSGKVMQKAGLQLEGRFRLADVDKAGNLVDTIYYGILAGDYHSNY